MNVNDMQVEQTMPSTLSPFMKTLLAACQAAPSADNSQPCHIDWSPSKLVIRYDTERVSGLTFPFKSRATLLSAGGIIENISQCCEKYGVDMAAAYFPEDFSEKKIFSEIKLRSANHIVEKNVDDNLFFRHTNRFSYLKKKISQGIFENLSSMTVGSSRIKCF